VQSLAAVLPLSWERTNLVVRTVFKIAEAVVRRLVGSIPTRSRQVKTLPPRLSLDALRRVLSGDGLSAMTRFSLYRGYSAV